MRILCTCILLTEKYDFRGDIMAEAYVIKTGGSGGGGVYIGNSAPAANLQYKLWVNTANNTLLYYNGSAWVQVVGVWG